MNDVHSTFELMLFGAFEARIAGVSLTRALSTKSRLLLAFLTLHSDRPVGTYLIADAVFPDSQAEDPHEIIKKTVQDIRRGLGEEAYRLSAPAPRMLMLNLDDVTVDWKIFHAALKQGSIESLLHAVAVHSRPFLEMEAAPWAIAEQTHCLQLRQAALETLFWQAMDKGETANAGNRLSQQFVFDAPFLAVKEELWRELLSACLLRQDFGLLHYHYMQLKTFLEHTAGRIPEPATQALYQQIPRPVLLQILQRKDRKKKSVLPITTRLPNFPYTLMGREHETRQLQDALASAGLVTIVGMGGVGKTRLSVQVAREIASDGKQEAGFLDLAACSESGLIQTIAATLGIKESVGTPLYNSVSGFLGSKNLLLIMDNCEHIIEASAKLCADLLRDCPNLRLLATSRETLRVDGERVFTLSPLVLPALPLPDWQDYCEIAAVRLFVERARVAHPHFQLTAQNAPLVVQLCRLADGLPLGIEIIASQTRGVSLGRIAADLAGCILHLEHRRRGIVPRHRNLMAALDWSFSLSSRQEQALLRRLAIFAGGWTLEAAEQVCSDDTLPQSAISERLSDLTAKSLAVMVASDGETLRYHLLETVRSYADEHLSASEEREQLQGRYLHYFMSLAEEAERQLSGENQKQWLAALDAEAANLRASLHISLENDVEAGLRLACGLQRYWEIRGYIGEGKNWCSALLDRTNLADRSVAHARVIDLAGWFANILGDYENATVSLQKSLSLFREQGNETDASLTLLRLGLVKVNREDFAGARELFEASLAIRRELKDERQIAMALMNLGIAVFNLLDYPLAQALYEEALCLLKLAGDQRSIASCLGNLARVAIVNEEYALADALFEESITISESIGDNHSLRFTFYVVGNLAAHTGNLKKAYSAYAQCLQLSREAQVNNHIIGSLEGLSNVLLLQEQWEWGVMLWGAAEVLRASHHFTLDTWELQRHARLKPEVIAAIGEQVYEQVLNTGRSLSQAAADALALGLLEVV